MPQENNPMKMGKCQEQRNMGATLRNNSSLAFHDGDGVSFLAMKKYCSEFLGTFGLVFAGTGAIIINQASQGAITHVGIALTFGLIVLAMIYTFDASPARHLNPADHFGSTSQRPCLARWRQSSPANASAKKVVAIRWEKKLRAERRRFLFRYEIG
jgi:hypothetical protein